MKAKTIYVDLDGSLIKTDLFVESIFRFLSLNPLNIITFISLLLKGRSHAKAALADKIDLDISSLPYRQDLLDYLKQEKANGTKIVLATASNRVYAKQVAEHLGLFDDVLASDPEHNLKGRRKLEAILKHSNGEPFAYVGDNNADIPIWQGADELVITGRHRREDLVRTQAGKSVRYFLNNHSQRSRWLKEMRLHQWAKNALIFVPLLTSHQYFDTVKVVQILWAFLAFSLCSSGVYFLNDLLDLHADRRHKTKCNRPLASGELDLTYGVLGAVLLPLSAFIISFLLLPPMFALVLLGYYLLTNSYSFSLKRRSTVDVMALGALYTVRIIAGGAAIGVAVSSWLMAFSVFLFVSLAYLKRYVEIADLKESDAAPGRGYSYIDKEAVFGLGIANMMAAMVIFALFIDSAAAQEHYRSPHFLWLLCFVLLSWGNRIWLGARRGKINEDPVVFAIRDRTSQYTGLVFIGVFLLAKYF